MGDLNEWTARGGCLRDFGLHHHFAATGRSFHAHRPLGKLDRIIASREVRFCHAGAHRSALSRIASDHLPVWAEVEV